MAGFPKWADFTPEFAVSELTRLLAVAERGVAALEAAHPVTFEGLVWGLDDAVRDLVDTWGMVLHMLGVMNSDAWRKVESDFQERMIMFTMRVSQSRSLYKFAKSIAVEDPMRRRILDRMVQEAELAGVALEGEKKERFNAIKAELARLGTDFSRAVLDATDAFKFEKDGKTYTIDDANFPLTMKNCPDREVRERLYRARVTRAPENTARISRILELRRELAVLLGYTTYAELSLANKCAPSVLSVKAMIDELDAATKEISEVEDVQVGEMYEGEGAMQPWDVAYCAERLRERKYAYSEEELKRYFEFEDVLKGLFRLSKFLFDIDIEEVKGADKPQTWHPDVRFFSVKENGSVIANFYVDPYVRNGQKNGGAWMNEFSNRDDRRGEKPLAVLVLNQQTPDADGKCYMPFREVETLFHEFGHSLQCMLTRIGEESAAGINLVEWDAVEIASQFMENWCLDDRTGIVVPEDLKAKVKAAKNFRAASLCRRQLAFAKTDMILHSESTEDPNVVKNREFRHFGIPLIEGDLFLNAFGHIFGGGYAAGYYGYKWSEVMSADCYGAFEEAGLADDEAVRRVGRAYRETVLALGGSESAYDVFVRFRGRKPKIDALLRQQGLA